MLNTNKMTYSKQRFTSLIGKEAIDFQLTIQTNKTKPNESVERTLSTIIIIATLYWYVSSL